ncbi:MAG: universal stress protein, partial [Deltaproteobacteria bacterium]|nr:universal stress protein [Deltaproteobacteria bacterium]
VLFPADLSEISTIIAPYVIDLAEQLGAEIHVLFVARSLNFYRDLLVPASSIHVFEEEISKGGHAAMKKFIDDVFKGRSVLIKLLRGEPSEVILEYAKETDIDIIVMGTHGRKGLDRIFFGSVAEQVVKTSPVPVVTINPYRLKIFGPGGSNFVEAEELIPLYISRIFSDFDPR